MKYKHYIQNESSDCGIAVMETILAQFNIESAQLYQYVQNVLKGDNQNASVQGLSLDNIQSTLEKFGVISDAYEVDDIQELVQQKFPIIVMTKNEGMPHYCVIHEIRNKTVIYSDPSVAYLSKKDIKEFLINFMGYAICINKIEHKKNQKNTFQSYPERILKQTISDISYFTKLFAILNILLSLTIPILVTYATEYLIGKYADRADPLFLFSILFFFMGLSLIYYLIMRYNTDFKINVGNSVEKKF